MAYMKDIKSSAGIVHLLDPQDLAYTDTVSSILDTHGFNGAMILVSVGALTGVDASNYLTPVLQESDTTTGTDFEAVDSSDIIGGFSKIDAAAEDSTTQTACYIGTKRYIRVNLDYTGTSITAGVVGVVGILGRPEESPATAPAAVSAV